MKKVLWGVGFAFSAVVWGQPKLVYTEERGGHKQVVIQTDGEVRALTGGALWHFNPDLSADGSTVTFSEGIDGEQLDVVTLDLSTGKKTIWNRGQGRHLQPRLSADGHTLAFSSPVGPESRAQIVVVGLTDGSREVIASPYPSFFPALSRDGRFVVFQIAKERHQKDIVLYDRSRQLLTSITHNGTSITPVLSSDDQWIAYSSFVDGQWRIFLSHRSKGETFSLKTPFATNLTPAFTPDGGILFAGDVGDRFRIFQIAAGEIRRKIDVARPLALGAGDLFHPALSR
jgi:Tol biopolymer transport system component